MTRARVGSAAYKADQAAKTAKLKAVTEAIFQDNGKNVFLEYHDGADWAVRKAAAGLRLTPEAVDYMEREVKARKLADEARKKNLETENAVLSETRPDVGGEPVGNGAGDVRSPDNGVQKGS